MRDKVFMFVDNGNIIYGVPIQMQNFCHHTQIHNLPSKLKLRNNQTVLSLRKRYMFTFPTVDVWERWPGSVRPGRCMSKRQDGDTVEYIMVFVFKISLLLISNIMIILQCREVV